MRVKDLWLANKGSTLILKAQSGEVLEIQVQRTQGTDNYLLGSEVRINGEVVKEIHFRLREIQVMLVDMDDLVIVQAITLIENCRDFSKVMIDFPLPFEITAA
ncbi:MAG: hypothetical protein SGJ04_08855 [Bacteroidota bacterium]|nr:hypothetical protein [Bacteroidota bacterium]